MQKKKKKKTDPVVSCYFLYVGEKKRFAGGIVSTQEFCEIQTKTGFIFVVFSYDVSDSLSVLGCDAWACIFKEE